MKNQDNNVTTIVEAIQTIEAYYDYSFKIHNSRCYPLINKLIQQLEDVLGCIDIQQKEEVQATLMNIVEAISSNDYVKLRDILYYDLITLLQKLIDE